MTGASDIFRVLADPTRLAAFELLAHKEMTVSDLTSRFEVSQPAISQHMAVLRTHGLVCHRKVGRAVYYRANPSGIAPIFRWIDVHRAFWEKSMPKLAATLKEMKDE